MGNYRKDKLTLSYNKAQKDFVVAYPDKPDGHLIVNHIIGDVFKWNILKDYPTMYDTFNLKDELERRGYNITTLKFSIEKKKQS